MKVAGLLSGGKDSCYNMLECVRRGHEITCLVNLLPADESINELDSFMFQTVGHNAIDAIAEAMDLPLIRVKITGTCIESELKYTPHEGDEVEDLYYALKKVKEQYPDIEGVSVGAILSNYQRERVENVCHRLGLISLAYLWRREQRGLLGDMVDSGIDAILIKTATIGLNKVDIGKSILQLYSKLIQSEKTYGCNPCGEGGEYETFTLDAPIYKKRIVIDDASIICHLEDRDAPVYLYVPRKWHLEEKEQQEIDIELPQPSVVPPEKMIEDEPLLIEHLETYDLVQLKNLQDISSITVVTKDAEFQSYLTEFTNPPLLRVIYSSNCKQTLVKAYRHQQVRNQTWYSRSAWCPGALYSYALIASTYNVFSIPMILPVESDSLEYTCTSSRTAYALCREYNEKLVSTISRYTRVLSTCLLFNEQYPKSSFPFVNETCMIYGTVASVEKGCAVQYSSRGFILNEEEVSEEMEDGHLRWTLGENATYDIYYAESLQFTLPTSSHCNVEITLYVDTSRITTMDSIQSFIQEYQPIIVPVKNLGIFYKKENKDYPLIIEMMSFN